jgi:hypothetical protein
MNSKKYQKSYMKCMITRESNVNHFHVEIQNQYHTVLHSYEISKFETEKTNTQYHNKLEEYQIVQNTLDEYKIRESNNLCNIIRLENKIKEIEDDNNEFKKVKEKMQS